MVDKNKKWYDDKYFYEPWDDSLDEPMTEEQQKEWDQEIDDIIAFIDKENKKKDK